MAFVSRKSMRNNYRGTNNNNTQQSTRKETTSEAVTNRDFIVICADKSGRVATFTENDKYIASYSKYSNDSKLNMFEQLRDVLWSIPCHSEELLDKQVAIYVPSAICFINSKDNKNLGDMYRSDKYESCQDIMLEVSEMLNARALNCFIVDIQGSGATIVQHAYEYVREESKRANAAADGVEYVAPSKAAKASDPLADKIAELKIQLADAMIAGDDDKVAKLQSALAVLESGKVAPKAEPKATEAEVVDEFANVEL